MCLSRGIGSIAIGKIVCRGLAREKLSSGVDDEHENIFYLHNQFHQAGRQRQQLGSLLENCASNPGSKD